MNPASSVRRMISGYVLRDGNYGTSNLNVTGRITLPAWAARAQGRSTTLTSTQYGPGRSRLPAHPSHERTEKANPSTSLIRRQDAAGYDTQYARRYGERTR